MHLLNEGDKSKSVCYKCNKIVDTTFRFDEYKIPGTDKVAPRILQGFCDICGELVSIPHQSTYEIRKFLDKGE
jgi:hypothetical protein